jgi:DNA ligase (NAD+)
MTKEEVLKRMRELAEQIEEHNYRYYVLDKPVISDYEFDKLLEELQKLEKQYPDLVLPDSPTQRVGGTITKIFPTVKHKYPMLSLSNTYSIEELYDFDRRVKELLDLSMSEKVEYVCELKIDGLSISLIYENGYLIRAVTRGDGIQGDEVTANVKTIRSIPLKLKGHYLPDIEVRGEIFMPVKVFEKLNQEREEIGDEPFANPRNAASGTMKLQDSSEVAKRKLDAFLYYLIADNLPYQTHWECLKHLKEWGFKVNENAELCKGIEEVKRFIDKWEEKRWELPYETDGVVVKVNDLQYQKTLGNTAKSPRWAVAFKYKPEQATTQLKSISYQVGRTGVVTPVANLEPVLLAGTKVKRASLHNADIIEKLDLHEHDFVIIEKGGEIIPKIVAVDTSKRPAHSKKVHFITHCPECGTKLIRNEDEAAYYCPNEFGCRPQIIGKIVHFVSRKAMDIQSLGEETIELLYDNHLIKNVADLYELKEEQIIPLERMGEKSAHNIITGIQESKKRPFERVLFALGIRHVGETLAKKIARAARSIDHLQKMSIEELTQIEDVGETIAHSIKEYLSKPQNQEIIRRLKQHGLQFEIEGDVHQSDKLKGLTIVISGTFKRWSRDELKELIERNGGKNTSSVSKKTSYLLAGEDPGPEKIKKAKELAVKIIDEDTFAKMIE